MSLLGDLREEHAKDGMFNDSNVGVSYPLGFPILDQLLGFYQDIIMPDGTTYRQTRLGVPAGTITMFCGPSQSGKTAAAIQAAYNIIEPFGDLGVVLHMDAEESTEQQRIIDLTGMTVEEYSNRYNLCNDDDAKTYEGILKKVAQLCAKKETDKDKYMYNTGFYNIKGEEIVYYVPSCVIIDSQMKVTSEGLAEDLSTLDGLTGAGREAIFRGKFYRNLLSYCKKYNINVIVINHLGNDIQMQPGKGGPKQLTFVPTGKNIPGGDKALYYTTSLIIWQPINGKDGLKTEEESGYNGLPVKALVCKARSGGNTGYSATLEFVQSTGYDPRFILLNLAKDKGLIQGRNPKCYFESVPDVKFDTRIFLKEMTDHPEIVRALFSGCKPILQSMVREPISDDDFMGGRTARNEVRNLLKDLY